MHDSAPDASLSGTNSNIMQRTEIETQFIYIQTTFEPISLGKKISVPSESLWPQQTSHRSLLFSTALQPTLLVHREAFKQYIYFISNELVFGPINKSH